MGGLTELFATVVFWVAGGYALRKAGVVRPEAAADVTQVVIWLTLPCLILASLHGAPLGGMDLAMPALGWALSIASVMLGWGLARALKLPPGRAGALILALAFGNTTFLGYPVIDGLFPPPAPQLTLAILFDQLGATFAVNTLGVAIASASAGIPVSVRALGGRLLRFPPLWALVVGLALHAAVLPVGLLGFLRTVGALTIPLMLLAMGTSLRFGLWRQAGGLVAIAAPIKLVVMPAAMFLVVTALGLPVPHRQAAVLEAAMPTMFYSLALAVAFELEVPLVVNTIVLTTLLSAFTLPLWRMLLP